MKKTIIKISNGHWERVDGSAEAIRLYLSDTEGRFWGWIVRSTSDRFSHSDPIPTMYEALDALKTWGDPIEEMKR